MTRILAVLVLLTACKGGEEPVITDAPGDPPPVPTAAIDEDNDGYTAAIDCDDANATVHPGAIEVCNGVDDDCNGETDDDPIDGIAAYADGDQDGYGVNGTALTVCGTVPAGFVSDGGDCDDANAHAYPGAPEACDDVDADCDGTPGYLDADTAGEASYYLDADGDGYGVGAAITACAPPAGYTSADGDCDDTDPSSHPNGVEVCDDADNNCDGTPDEGLGGTYYLDADGDGYGSSTGSIEACQAPIGYVADNTDCDDTRNTVYPGAAEVCDTYDNDCDTYIDDLDDDTLNQPSWYADADLDGFGYGDGVAACTQPADTVSNGDDCDDANPAINPGAEEICDSIDNDCDTYADDEDPQGVVDGIRFYADLDLDNYGDPQTYYDLCLPGPDLVPNGDDCDDTNAAVNPQGIEVCNGGIDDNCDGVIDDDDPLVVLGTFYVDADEDGYGDPLLPPLVQCEIPLGYALLSDDCDDTRDTVYPGADEICDTYDNDCDTYIDDLDDDLVAPLYYLDEDADGYGAEPGTAACVQPPDTLATGGDCDDTRATIYPGADEICDTYDNDCDTYIDDEDDDLLGDYDAYTDADGDGYGYGDTVSVCVLGQGYVLDNTDCDDALDTIYPGADEICDTYDNDCDTYIDDLDDDVLGELTAYLDADGDGYGYGASELVCVITPGWSDNDADCDDAAPLTHPGAFDWGDAADNNCNGVVDEDVGTETYNSDDVQQIWTTSCGPCHTQATAGGLSLLDAWTNTVNVPSSDVPAIDQIEPGSPVDSYLWATLLNTRAQVGGAGSIMPPAGALSETDLTLIETWILEGAVQAP